MSANVFAQSRYSAEKGSISFTSNAKLELINATSNKVKGLLDASNSQFAFVVQVQSFEGFNSELQRQHFNERYMESEKFYEATFAGKIIEQVDFSKNGVYEVRAKGNLTIHGKKQPRIIKGTITVKDKTLTVDSEFSVPLADHDISIPQIVSQKIATEILVKFNAIMTPAAAK
jgi:polyisoprenoid-binding protein YceI